MKRLYLLSIIVIAFLPSCTNISISSPQDTQNLAIQAYADSPIITTAIQELTPKINGIIKQELGLGHDYDFAFFIPKKRQRLTLYYVIDIAQENNPLLISALEQLHLTQITLSDVHASSHVECFGERQDELVIVIDDKQEQLASLHQQIKTAIHNLNANYQKEHEHGLYNQEQSERFPFMPHMGIGRIRLGSIRNHTQDQDVLNRIITKVKDAAHEQLQHLITRNGSLLHFYSFGILDLQKQIYLKEWNLNK